MQVEIYSGSLSRLRTEVLALACFKDVRPLGGLAGEVDWVYSGVFSRMIMQHHFTGFHAETLLIPTEGKLHIPKVVLTGLGPHALYDAGQFQIALDRLIETIAGLQVRDCAIATASFCGEALEIPWVAEAFIQAWQETQLISSMALNLVVNEIETAKVLQHQIKNGRVFERDLSKKEVSYSDTRKTHD